MPQTIIFLGSSSAARSQAKAILNKFSSPTLKFLPWWEIFTPGRTLIEELDAIRGKVNGAILLFTPESTTIIRNRTREISNLNVLFEFGYFYGCLGKQRVAMIKYGDLYLPSDFDGYIHIFGSESFRRSGSIPVSKRTTNEFTRWIQQV